MNESIYIKELEDHLTRQEAIEYWKLKKGERIVTVDPQTIEKALLEKHRKSLPNNPSQEQIAKAKLIAEIQEELGITPEELKDREKAQKIAQQIKKLIEKKQQVKQGWTKGKNA